MSNLSKESLEAAAIIISNWPLRHSREFVAGQIQLALDVVALAAQEGTLEKAARVCESLENPMANEELAMRYELKVGQEVWLRAEILEVVEPNNRGIGVKIFPTKSGKFELPLWVDADALAVLNPPLAAPGPEAEVVFVCGCIEPIKTAGQVCMIHKMYRREKYATAPAKAEKRTNS